MAVSGACRGGKAVDRIYAHEPTGPRLYAGQTHIPSAHLQSDRVAQTLGQTLPDFPQPPER